MCDRRIDRLAACDIADRPLLSGRRKLSLEALFIGTVLTAVAVGPASATMPGDGPGLLRTTAVVSGGSPECAGGRQEWTPRTLRVGEGGGVPDALSGSEDVNERSNEASDCALV